MAKLCLVCNSSLQVAIELKALPLTGLYSEHFDPQVQKKLVHDQQLMVCPNCSHVQIGHLEFSKELYDLSYTYRTSASTTSRNGVNFFCNTLTKEYKRNPEKKCLEIGCNDGYLLNLLSKDFKSLVGIDALWENQTFPYSIEKNCKIYGGFFESMNFDTKFDLIVSRHTIEHVSNLQSFFSSLRGLAHSETVFAFEFPGFEFLLDHQRFDQVFHQHINYFTLPSFKTLLRKHGFELTKVCVNPNLWGAYIMFFKLKRGADQTVGTIYDGDVTSGHALVGDIQKKYAGFSRQMQFYGELVKSFKSGVIGFGAAQMLPVIFYHMGIDGSDLSFVVDDDMEKNEKFYANLNLQIRSLESVADKSFLEKQPVLLTAPDSMKPILKRLMGMEFERIINPFVYVY
jgi:SAM-dependent methyltransferase